MAAPRQHTRRDAEFREEMKAIWQPINAPCALCGQSDIDWDGPRHAPKSFELEHRRSVINHPELRYEPANAQPSHSKCNRNKGAGQQVAGLGVTSETW